MHTEADSKRAAFDSARAEADTAHITQHQRVAELEASAHTTRDEAHRARDEAESESKTQQQQHAALGLQLAAVGEALEVEVGCVAAQ